MARRGWNSLSPDYRKTLERGGITQEAYERGDSLKKARRHEKTPERPPRDLAKAKAQYPAYVQNRQRLENRVEALKRELWKDYGKYNPMTARQNLERRRPTIAQMQRVLDMDLEEVRESFESDKESFSFLGYK